MNLLDKIQTLPITEQETALRVATGEIYKSSLYLTAKKLLGFKDVIWRTHGDTIKALEVKTNRKLIVMPRGTFKSSIASVAFPIWLLIKNPNERIILDSELYSNSKNFLREIKYHLETPRLTQLFGKFKTEGTWNEGEIIINQRTEIKKEATITCSGIGAQKTGQHYSVAILDDMNSPANSNTPEGCEKVVNHYRYYQSILDPGGTLVIVATRYSAQDLVAFVLKNEINFERETKGLL